MPDLYRRRQYSLFALSLLVGIGMSSWVTRTPAVRDAVGASTAEVGMILFGLSVGSMVGVLSAGAVVRRRGARPVIMVGTVLAVVGLAVIAVAAGATTAIGVFAGLLLVGLGGGFGEIGLNIEAAAVETATRRSVLPLLHGCFSLGTVVGALVGIGMTAVQFPVVWHLLLAAAFMAALAAWAFPGIPAGTGQVADAADRSGLGDDSGADSEALADGGVADGGAQPGERRLSERRPSVWRDSRLLLIGVVVLAMAFAEGTANDWLPLLMVDGHGVSATGGSLVYTGFALAMTVGRFAGGPFVVRFGRASVLCVSAVAGAIGVAGVAFAPNPVLAGFAVALWGLGASLGFPLAISAAGDDPERGAERVSAVATSGYLAFLVGPPLLGFLGEHAGLRQAMLVVIALLVIAALAARGARAPGPVPAAVP